MGTPPYSDRLAAVARFEERGLADANLSLSRENTFAIAASENGMCFGKMLSGFLNFAAGVSI